MAADMMSETGSNELERLVDAARGGDRAAFGALYEHYHPRVMSTALRCVSNPGDAQELCHDVFVKALEKIDQLRTASAFGGWLRSITVRLAINRTQRGRSMVTVDLALTHSNSIDEATPESNALANERTRRVRQSLDRLRRLDQETLRAFYLEGRSLREMSAQFDAKLGTIKRRLHDARKRMSEDIEEHVSV